MSHIEHIKVVEGGLMEDKQSRKYLLTINNPEKLGLTHEVLKDKLCSMNCLYWAMSDEIGENGTYHTHVYFVKKSAVRFSTVQKRFYGAHIDHAYGTSIENRDYLMKQGKWKDTKKSETSVEGTFEEFGELPNENSENLSSNEILVQMISEGESDASICKSLPKSVNHIKNYDVIRQAILREAHGKEMRNVTVTYIFGDYTIDKTAKVYALFPFSDIYRITDYRNGKGVRFDSYTNQKVIVFETFMGEIPITSLLPMLDKYPLNLSARYSDKIACYEYVYFISEINPKNLYRENLYNRRDLSDAFMDKLNNIVEYKSKDKFIIHKGNWEDPVNE